MSFTIPDEVLANDNFDPDENESIALNLVENKNLVNELDEPEELIGQIDPLENNDADRPQISQIWDKYQRKCRKILFFDWFYELLSFTDSFVYFLFE